MSASKIIWSSKWKENSSLAVEKLTVLDLVDAVAKSMKGVEEGKMLMCIDCRRS